MKLDDFLSRFDVPSVKETVETLNGIVADEMNYGDKIIVLTKEEAENRLGADIQISRLMNKLKEVQDETKHCSFRIQPDKVKGWRVYDHAHEHLKRTFYGEDLGEALRETILFIEENRVPRDSEEIPYKMRCKYAGFDVSDERIDITV